LPEKKKPPTNLFTGAGDEGYTGLLGKARVPKYDLHPEALGAVDEANAVIGVGRAGPGSDRTKKLLWAVQRDLWQLMGDLAAAKPRLESFYLKAERVAWLESRILELDQELPQLRDFVSPGVNLAEANLHVARTVVRRAERAAARLCHAKQDYNPAILRYLNRLSSLLYTLALYEAYLAGEQYFTVSRKTEA
jgi:cob(I)alamin adenosyltransferase